MRRRQLVAAAMITGAVSCGGMEQGNESPPLDLPLSVRMIDRQGREAGSAELRPGPSGLTIALAIEHLPPGEHAIHIHEAPHCDPPGFETAGGHFNPEGRSHGLQNPDGPHAGDLPNITIAADSSVRTELVGSQLSLSGGTHGILAAGGGALVIHAGPDDYRTDPAGAAGDRIACGVIAR